MEESVIRVGLIGAGSMGRTHACILADDRRARLAAVFDTEAGRAAAAAAEFGAPRAATLDELWRACDAVYIAAPNVRHGELALAAIAAGKHVFCEKPMATDLAAAKRVAEAAAASSKIFQVGHNRRFAPVYQRAREVLASGGPALCVQIKMNRGELENPPWTADAGVTGGFLYETPIHVLDLANWLFGPVQEVYAVGGRRVYQQADTFSAVMSFLQCEATLTTCAYSGWSFPFERVEIYGCHLTIRTEEMERVEVAIGLDKPIEVLEFGDLPREARWGYIEEDRLFLDAVEKGGQPPVTAQDGLNSVRAVEALYGSLRERRPVKV